MAQLTVHNAILDQGNIWIDIYVIGYILTPQSRVQ